MAKPEPRAVLLDAAMRVVARGGMRALSHRAIETQAGFAHGSTSYHLGTRDQIVQALLVHVAERDILMARQALQGIATTVLAGGDINVDVAAHHLLHLVTSDAERLVTRYELFLEAARRPELREPLARWRSSYVDLCTPLLARFGAADPPTSARWLVAALDGLLLDRICLGERGHGKAMALTPATVRGLIDAAVNQ